MNASTVLADDAVVRTSFDPEAPVDIALAPVLSLLSTQGCPGNDASIRVLMRAVAATGLLDIGLDALLAETHGWPAACADSARSARLLFDAAVDDIATLCPAAARHLCDQRHAMETLARGRRTIANERLLQALRRGTATVVLPDRDRLPLSGELLPDGRLRISGIDLPVHGSPLGAALVLVVRLSNGGEVVGWTGLTAGQVVPVADRGDAEWCGRITAQECFIGADEVISSTRGGAAFAYSLAAPGSSGGNNDISIDISR
ncbi:hypothetical protein [Austwickia chelonae]|uniref:hypothetical protein n=1 Tax=Austwickia chelonae TaxID=100225 RepID=UPI0013C32CB0|nr:hypothetical protein [Austwickia chelonae]